MVTVVVVFSLSDHNGSYVKPKTVGVVRVEAAVGVVASIEISAVTKVMYWLRCTI